MIGPMSLKIVSLELAIFTGEESQEPGTVVQYGSQKLLDLLLIGQLSPSREVKEMTRGTFTQLREEQGGWKSNVVGYKP